MKAPVGALPASLVHLDDTLLESQMCADSQEANTAQMLEAFRRILADGRIDHHDADEVLFVRRHVALEHQLNHEQCSLLRWARWATNNVTGVIQDLRSKLQTRRRAALTHGSSDAA